MYKPNTYTTSIKYLEKNVLIINNMELLFVTNTITWNCVDKLL